MAFATVATFNELSHAEECVRHLQAAGVPARVRDESKVQRFCFWVEPYASKKVQVSFADFSRAWRTLEELDKTAQVLQHAVRCPECKSSRVEYPQATRKFATPMLVESLISLGLIPREFYCQDCHYTWPRAVKPEPERDILGWSIRSPSTSPAAPTRRPATDSSAPAPPPAAA